jgi:small multidrug resistance family-3 protein
MDQLSTNVTEDHIVDREIKEDESSSLNNNDTDTDTDTVFQWTIGYIILAIVLFVGAGIAEIVGGWFVWKSIRTSTTTNNSNNTTTTTKKPYWWGIIGCLLLILYGYIPTLQPTNSFGRIYAVYGGFFIILSFLFGWLLDGDKPDL